MSKNKIVVFLIFYSVQFFSQNKAIDSLKNIIAQSKVDTIKLYNLNRLIEILPDGDWQKCNVEMGNISKKIINEKKADERSIHVAKKFYSTYLNNIGYDAFQKGNVQKSIEFYHQSLKMFEAIGEKYDAANVNNNLGFIYFNENDMTTALKYYLKCLKSNQEIKHKNGIAVCYNNIGLCYYTKLKAAIGKKGNTDSVRYNFNKAFWYFTNANQLQENGNDSYAYAMSTNNLGVIFGVKGDHYKSIGEKKDSVIYFLKKAISFHEKALSLFEDFGNIGGIFEAKNSIGYIYYLLEDYDRALIYCKDALKVAEKNKLPQKISLAAKHLYRIYNSVNNSKDALTMYVLYIQMRDSIANDKNRKLLIQKEFQYEYEKKSIADSVKVVEEKKVTDAQLKQEQTLRYALYVGIVIVFLFSMFLYNRFRVTQKQKHLIELKEQETQKQNIIITQQKHLVEEHQKEILDSIHYAKRIQNSLLAHHEFLNENLPNNFVYFNPKDIVSGDFYWATKHGDNFYIAVCDSTGHGVPGAFMSLLNIGFLSEAINEKNILDPHNIFNYVRKRLIESISKEGQKDGFDGILLCINQKTNTFTYSAANNEPILISNNNLIELEKDRMPVGKGEKINEFTLHTINAKPGDSLYLYTDGFADQFGGPKGKKFKYKTLNELLFKNSQLPLNEQLENLKLEFNNWKGDLEQVDDVLIIGLKL